MRAAAYLRVSTAEQVEGTSIETQAETVRSYCKAKGWELVETFADEGVSGALESRPQLDRLLAGARAGAFEVVVVAKLDRWARSARIMHNALHVLDEAGVDFASVAESIDGSTAAGRLFRSMLGDFSEFERSRIEERTQEGREARAADGGWTGGYQTPFGYRVTHEGGRARLEVDPDEAETVRTAAALLVDEGLSTKAVADRLHALGHTPRKAKRFGYKHVRRMLQSETIAGSWAYNRRSDRETIDIEVPAILERDRWELVQRLLDSRSKPRSGSRAYLLTGILEFPCGSHGSGVYVNRADRRYYACADKRARRHSCDSLRVRADELEEAVWSEISNVLSEPERLVSLAEEFLSTRAGQMATEISQREELERKVANLEESKGSRAAELLKAGVDAQTVASAVAEIEAELDELRRHLRQIDTWADANRAESDARRRLWELAEHGVSRLSSMSAVERARVLELLNIRVVVTETGGRYGDTKAQVTGAIPVDIDLTADSYLRDASSRRCGR